MIPVCDHRRCGACESVRACVHASACVRARMHLFPLRRGLKSSFIARPHSANTPAVHCGIAERRCGILRSIAPKEAVKLLKKLFPDRLPDETALIEA